MLGEATPRGLLSFSSSCTAHKLGVVHERESQPHVLWMVGSRMGNAGWQEMRMRSETRQGRMILRLIGWFPSCF